MKLSDDVRWNETILELRQKIEVRLANLRNDAVYTRKRLMEAIEQYNMAFPTEAIRLSQSQLRYLIETRLIRAEADPTTGDYRFNRRNIVDIVLVQTLRQHQVVAGRRLNLLQI